MGLDAGDGKLDKTEFGIMHADLCRSGFHLESLQAASLLTRLRCGRKLLVYSFRTYLLSTPFERTCFRKRQQLRHVVDGSMCAVGAAGHDLHADAIAQGRCPNGD